MDDPMMNETEEFRMAEEREAAIQASGEMINSQNKDPRYCCIWEPPQPNPPERLFDALTYKTLCGKTDTYEQGPFERGFKFCPYCGGELLVAPTGELEAVK